MRKLLFALLCTLLLCLNGLATWAQLAQLQGKVTDPDAEPLPYVTVHARTASGLEYAAITDSLGQYSFDAIPSGKLAMVVEESGFVRFEETYDLKPPFGRFDIELRPPIYLDQVVISATRTEVPRSEAPVLVGVVNTRTLVAANAVSIADGLGFQPGLRVETNCQNCGFTQLRMNGLPGPYTQILINSRPIFSALNGVYGLEQIPTNLVDRIEVVRGGGSALFGANAVAGTVNIITKEPTANFWQMSHNAQWVGVQAPDHTFSANGGLVNTDQTLGVVLMGQHRVRAAWDANGDDFTEITRLRNTTFGFDAFYKPWTRAKISLNGYGISEYRRGGNRLDDPPHVADIAEELSHQTYAGGFTLEQILPNDAHRLSAYVAGQSTDRRSYYGAGQDLNAYGVTHNASLISGVQHTVSWGRFLSGTSSTVSGLEFKLDNVHDRMPGYNRDIDQKTNMLSVFVQHSHRVGSRLTLLLGLRMDKHNLLAQPVWSPRANVLVNIAQGLAFRLSYGRGFRPPQAFDEDLHLSFVGGEAFLVRLSPGLRAESSHSLSTSLDWTHLDGPWQYTLTLTGFYTRLVDPFVLTDDGLDPDSNRVMIKVNGAGAAVYGGSLEGLVAFGGKFQLEAGFTLQGAQYDEPLIWTETSPQLAVRQFLRTPDWYGYWVGSYRVLPSLVASLSGNLTGPMWAPHYAGYVAQDELERTPTFVEVNAKLSYDIDLGNALCITVFGGCQNILNSFQQDFDQGPLRDANYIHGPSRPRTVFVGLKLSSL